MTNEQPTICIDLDGTIATYNGWQGEEHFGEVLPNTQSALKKLKALGWTLIIFTTRSDKDKIRAFLEKEQLPFDHINENPNQPSNAQGGKVLADVYVDDRAIRFRGDWNQTLEEILKNDPTVIDSQQSDLHTIEAINFLGRDFSESFSQMRHYDMTALDITKFTLGQLLLSIAAAWTVYTFSTDPNASVEIKQNWSVFVSIILFVSCMFSTLAIMSLLRIRVYFTYVAKYINEQRAFFLKSRPLGFDNKAGMYMDYRFPKASDSLSSQLLSVYIIAITQSGMLGVAIASIFHYLWSTTPFLNIAIISTFILILLTVAGTLQYLSSKDGKSADEAVFGRTMN